MGPARFQKRTLGRWTVVLDQKMQQVLGRPAARGGEYRTLGLCATRGLRRQLGVGDSLVVVL